MVLTAAGQTLQVPTYLVPTSGAQAAAGPAFIAICLPPPDVPVGTPGRATFGAKVYSAELTINGVFSPVATGAWISSWVPYTPGAGTPNAAGVVVSPAAVAPGAVSIAAKISGRGAIVSGTRHAGRSAPRWCDRHGLRRNREGEALDAQASPRRGEREVHDKFAVGTFFRADAAATGGAAAARCARSFSR